MIIMIDVLDDICFDNERRVSPVILHTRTLRVYALRFLPNFLSIIFFVPLTVSSIYASTASLFSSVNFLSVRVHRNTGDTLSLTFNNKSGAWLQQRWYYPVWLGFLPLVFAPFPFYVLESLTCRLRG